MFEKKKLLLAILTASLSAGMTACGGGSSSSSSSDTTNVEDQQPATDETDTTVSVGTETGRFVDSAVGGLEYETSAGYKSITNSNGEFRYNEGDSISFTLGALNFGTVNGKGLVTPVDLAASDSSKTANIARVLQTLDDDGIPDNGITITPEAREKAANQNPTDVATTDLEALKNTILSLASKNTVAPTDLVTEAEATSHLEETLAAETPVTSCGTATTPVTAEHLAGKTYGFIRSEGDDKEINLMSFGTDGSVTEFHNDRGFSEEKSDSTWSATTAGSVSFDTADGSETFTACAVESGDGSPYYLILEDPEGGILKLFATKPFTQPDSTQSYIITTITEASDGTLSELKNDIVTIDSELSAEFLSDVGMTNATITNGALEIPDERGQALDSTDELHLLAAQGQRIGIYLDFDSSGALLNVGTATNIPQANPVTTESFAGNTLVARDEEREETVILVYKASGILYDYHNDAYDSEGNQFASVYENKWAVDDATGELTETETVEYQDLTEEISETFRVFESANFMYFPERTEFGTAIEVRRASKTQSINDADFIGTYNVKIPTENTVDNELIINTNSCTYSGVACNWSIDTSGKATLDFGAGETATAQIWQLAGSADEFAFLITHSDDANDIEVGFMTRK